MKIDLTTCDQEPIHQPGSIQPHGVLLALERRGEDFIVRLASENVASMFGVDAASLAGSSLTRLLQADDVAVVHDQLRSNTIQLHPLYLRRVRGLQDGRAYDAIAHTHGGWYILELEPHLPVEQAGSDAEAGDLYRLVQAAIADVRSAGSVAQLCDRLALHVRKITGFDRVMVYRFDESWNGSVVSEQRRDDLEPFLGLHYPAADIPRQARELYTRNLLRFIADRDYKPVSIVPNVDTTSAAPLDMSYCVLRSVSPIHLQYLRNMGVHASMSISLLREGALWGLVACHHYSPRRVPYVLRNASEMIGQVTSLQIAMQERADVDADVARKAETIQRLVDAAEPGESFCSSLVDRTPNIMSLVDCIGAAVVMDEKVARVGQTPSDGDLQEIARTVCDSGEAVFCTRSYAADHHKPQLASLASGVIAMSLVQKGCRAILWFRPEMVRTIHWAGDPNKLVSKGEEPARLSPRGSFALWQETVRGNSVEWTEAERAAVYKLRSGILSKMLVQVDDLSRHNEALRRANSEREQVLESERAARVQAEKLNKLKDEFVATLSHELRTPLNAIQGWAHLLRSRPRDMAQVVEGLEVIERNARVQAQMVSDLLDINRISSGKLRLDIQPIDLPTLVESSVSTLQFAADNKQVRIQKVLDPMTDVSANGDPTRVQQIIWNLLSNAIKFTPKGGRILVVLRRAGSYVELSVTDSGIGIDPQFLPYVFDRFRQADSSSNRKTGGLGLGLAIVRHLVEMHGGTISAESTGGGKGSTFTVTLPVRPLNRNHAAPAQEQPSEYDDCDRLNLKNLHLLVVDDERDAREMLATVLADCGVKTTLAGSAAEALEAFGRNEFDVLLSDIGMPGEDGYSLIRKIREQEAQTQKPRLPAVALTAYARSTDRRQILLAGFQVHMAKPVDPSELLAVIANLTNRIHH